MRTATDLESVCSSAAWSWSQKTARRIVYVLLHRLGQNGLVTWVNGELTKSGAGTEVPLHRVIPS